ncbi:hypothetical protein KM1_120840 [Entamoeba histolytica HM-3:IMSS]|uniref:Uncharacterized protein n=6 Tax=Entamoeba histolytica TaxID=5759 RepID=C4M945_ENTH1|nr:hypothetical protein EHI_083610 [Entamoeba histolytica HM-1:IMSS]EAL49029.2 hypothetical protein EHI_083610 [Entamoeba histolytica HM-1:IMSS]EMD48425.1 Hypothetical protein EHI5A_037330 [Entamoeba histolytica KU27]EMS15812.1 hypothetical protein KM1_120840 [Entamoeba histolytica HM-3:IMSS]ENY64068.1 hypothetical protein EHI7A_062160 [Entamoeba histolytica HM-1:IMSS-A]|eukprot:XP_654421.2 hypothetical protein EHI_083610 [Entamoeba histolytica HM-1:IMSS]
MKSLKQALQHKPITLVIKRILFIKGCIVSCLFPIFNNIIDDFTKSFPEIEISYIEPPLNKFKGITGESWTNEVLSATWSRTGNPDWSRTKYVKHLTINYFFEIGIQTVIKNMQPNDFVLFAEDDQSYSINAFEHILKLMEKNQQNTCFSKIAIEPYKEYYKRTINTFEIHLWGAWGNLRSKNQLEIFLRYLKFSNFAESEDTLGIYLCKSLNQTVEVDCVSKHFGKDRYLPKI